VSKFIILLVLFTYNIFAHGETSVTRLFREGRAVFDYDERAGQLKSDEILEFEDGKQFKILEKIDSGSTTHVYKVAVGSEIFALRIPLTSGFWPQHQKNAHVRMNSFIDKTVASYNQIKDSKLRIPKLYSSLSGQYALMEYVPVDFTLNVFLQSPHHIKDPVRERALKALRVFAAAISEWQRLGDFKQGNIAYSDATQEWFFLDQLPDNQKLSSDLKKSDLIDHPFSGTKRLYTGNSKDWAPSVLQMLDDVIRAARCELLL